MKNRAAAVGAGSSASKTGRARRVCGWLAVVLVCVIGCLWAYWGGMENFHEGWSQVSVWENIAMMFVQYWLLALVFVAVGLLGIRLPKTTFGLCLALGVFAAVFFSRAHFSVLWLMIIVPAAGVGLLFLYGRPAPVWLARVVVAAPPLGILVVTSAIGIARVSQRVDDLDYGVRVVAGNGVTLAWAPRGPGWPETTATHKEATRICARLSEDGAQILDHDVGIWRLPTVEEAVRSQMLHGRSVSGTWDPVARKPAYIRPPDKETPLWDPHSPIIYYWTSTMADAQKAYIIVYHGGVFPRNTNRPYSSLSFRAVKEIR